jgi:hypothetical protein
MSTYENVKVIVLSGERVAVEFDLCLQGQSEHQIIELSFHDLVERYYMSNVFKKFIDAFGGK